jgi:hypothetical protein
LVAAGLEDNCWKDDKVSYNSCSLLLVRFQP